MTDLKEALANLSPETKASLARTYGTPMTDEERAEMLARRREAAEARKPTFDPDDWRRVTLEDLPALHDAIESTVEGWFLDGPIDREDLLRRLEGDRLPDGKRAEFGDWDDPVVEAVIRYARKVKRESA